MSIYRPSICALLNIAKSAQDIAKRKILSEVERRCDTIHAKYDDIPWGLSPGENLSYQSDIFNCRSYITDLKHSLAFVDIIFVVEFIYISLFVKRDSECAEQYCDDYNLLKESLVNTMFVSSTSTFSNRYLGFSWRNSRINDVLCDVLCDINFPYEVIPGFSADHYSINNIEPCIIYSFVKRFYEEYSKNVLSDYIARLGRSDFHIFEYAPEVAEYYISANRTTRRDPFSPKTYKDLLRE